MCDVAQRAFLRPIRCSLAPRGRSGLLLLSAALLWSRPAFAEEKPLGPGENHRALPGLLSLSLPTPAASVPVVAAGMGYGFLDDTGGSSDGDSRGHRFRGTASVAFSALPSLSIGFDLRAWVDQFSNAPGGSESNSYGEPRLTARFSTPAGESFLGAEVEGRLVGAEAPSVKFRALSPAIRGLFATRLGGTTWFGAQLGFHVDRSDQAVPHPERLSATDQRTLGASSWNAVQWGVGTSHRLSRTGTELLGELSGDWLVGSGSPKFTGAPWRLGLGARQPLNVAFSLLVDATLGLSSRPEIATLAAGALLPAEPRLSISASLIWRIGAQRAPTPVAQAPVTRPPAPVKPPPAPAPPAIQTPPVKGTVVDEGGHPLADVELTLNQEGAEPKTTRTFADGAFLFDDVPLGAFDLRVTTPGFDPQTIAISAEEEREREVVLLPSVPAGQLRGRVLDLRGNPITATLTITPGDQVKEVQADGSFALDLTPGRYTVKFQHRDFGTQYRKIRVHDRGVVILNIALSR